MLTRPDEDRRPDGTQPRLRTLLNVALSLAFVAIGIRTAPELLVGLGIAAAVGISCEVLAPLHEGRRAGRAWALDLTHAFGDRALIVPLVAVALGVAGPVVAAVVPGAVRDGLASLPWAAQVGVVLVATDLANYLIHRALHRVPFLWAFHEVHHSSERLDWLATSRVHPVDLAVNIVAVTLPTYALGKVELAPWLVTFFFVQPFVIHANARLRLPRVGRVLVTPVFHHWHHAAEASAYDRNFGMFLSVWDRLFGTALDGDKFPTRYGVDGGRLGGLDYTGQLTAPVRAATGCVRGPVLA